MAFPPLWPPRAGDIFFCRASDGFLNQEILAVERRTDTDGDTRCTHTGIIIADSGATLETTAGPTSIRDLAKNYAGSDVAILRWLGMTPERAKAGFESVKGQVGKQYPYGRLITAWLEIPGRFAKSGAMECDVLAASYLVGAGCPLGKDPWDYLPESLYDEMNTSPFFDKVFDGRMRAAGLVVGSGPDNRLVIGETA